MTKRLLISFKTNEEDWVYERIKKGFLLKKALGQKTSMAREAVFLIKRGLIALDKPADKFFDPYSRKGDILPDAGVPQVPDK
ncbi:MAG: hypothetical protein ACRC78_17950 [Planktothrix sp.]